MKRVYITALLGLLLGTARLDAQDRLFTYTYQSNVLNSGQREIEVWNTFKFGKDGFYRGFDHRLEFEVGIAKRLQTAFYFNVETATTRDERSYLTLGADNKPVLVSEPYIHTEASFSFSNEWKYKLSDPVANAIGSALYGEITLGGKELELEGKVILDKKFDKFVNSFNLVGEAEFEPEIEGAETEMELEAKLEADYALAYMLKNNFYLGFEARNLNVMEKESGENEMEVEHSAFFLGPCFSFSKGSFFINFTAMPQVIGLKGNTAGSLNLNEYERLQTRILLSYAF